MSTALLLVGALLLDRLLGEPRRLHPLVGFGRLADAVEGHLNRTGSTPLRGLAAWLLLVLPPAALTAWAATTTAAPQIALLALYLALGGRSLAEHAEAVATALRTGDLDDARRRVGFLVSRDTAAMDEAQVSRAAVESVLENGSDAVFGALFWFLVAGAPGVVLYRLANTLDAMWGYRTPRFAAFGWAAARLDDALNLVPARFTAVTYALVGRPGPALRCWLTQAGTLESPNAGPVMAAGAGSLGVRLGGPALYHGAWRARPLLGEGEAAGPGHIDRAVGLVRRGIVLWAVLALLGGALVHG